MNSKYSYKISKELLNAKLRYKQLFLFRINQIDLIFRPLSAAESEIASSDLPISEDYVQDWLLERALIYGSLPLDNVPGGFAETICTKLLNYSTIKSEEELSTTLNEKRNSINIKTTIEDFISAAYKTLTLEDIATLDQKEQLALVARAELLLGTNINIGTKKPARRGPPLREGFESMGDDLAPDWLSPEHADKPDFERDNREMM